MSFANEKGGYLKTLEITRENDNRSYTTLSTNFLEKAENYILNVTDFVTNTSPPMNLIEGAYLTIKPLGDQNDTLAQAAIAGPPIVEFTPSVYRSWLELARQLDVFFKDLSSAANNDNYAKFFLSGDGKMNLYLSHQFLSTRYIEVHEDVRPVLDCPQYIFKVRHVAGGDYHTNLEVDYSLFLANGSFAQNFVTAGVVEPFTFSAPRPLSNFEQRESIDVYCTFPMKSKISVFNEVEEHEHILFTLPYSEQHQFTSTAEFEAGVMVSGIADIQEDLDIGLTNLCEKHSATLHQGLLSGVIRNIQIRIAIRYVNTSGVTEKDFDFTNGGFWYLRVLFVKKV